MTIEELLKKYEDYLKNKKRPEKTIRIYKNKILELHKKGYTANDIIGGLEDFLQNFESKEYKKELNDHGNLAASLLYLAELILEEQGYFDIEISYTAGWSSFRPKSKHVSGYCITGHTISISYDKGFVPFEVKTKQINRRDFVKLAFLLRNGYRYLSKSNNLIMSNHGFLSDYSYSICGKSGFKCNFIFEDAHEYYNKSFLKLIDKLTK